MVGGGWGWGLHSHFHVQPNYSVVVVLWLCCVVVVLSLGLCGVVYSVYIDTTLQLPEISGKYRLHLPNNIRKVMVSF